MAIIYVFFFCVFFWLGEGGGGGRLAFYSSF